MDATISEMSISAGFKLLITTWQILIYSEILHHIKEISFSQLYKKLYKNIALQKWWSLIMYLSDAFATWPDWNNASIHGQSVPDPLKFNFASIFEIHLSISYLQSTPASLMFDSPQWKTCSAVHVSQLLCLSRNYILWFTNHMPNSIAFL